MPRLLFFASWTDKDGFARYRIFPSEKGRRKAIARVIKKLQRLRGDELRCERLTYDFSDYCGLYCDEKGNMILPSALIDDAINPLQQILEPFASNPSDYSAACYDFDDIHF